MVRQVSHEVAVMYLGRIVEQGDPDRLFAAPAHPYTQRAGVGDPGAPGAARQRLVLQGEPPNPVDVPAGCAFHRAARIAVARCRAETPALRPLADGRQRRLPSCDMSRRAGRRLMLRYLAGAAAARRC